MNFFLLFVGIAVSMVFRYVLCWEGKVSQYAYFVAMWLALIALLNTVDGKVLFSPHASDVRLSLSDKCEHSVFACVLRIRVALADDDLNTAKLYLQKGKQLGNFEELDQLEIMIDMVSDFSPSVEERVLEWLHGHPDDVPFRKIYAQQLFTQKRQQDAIAQYQLM